MKNKEDGLLRFTKNNAKTNGVVQRKYDFSLPAGHSCPGAKLCLAKADRATGKVTDGPDCIGKFRCYAATLECWKNVRESRWRNLELLTKARTAEKMAKLILTSLPRQAEVIRIHAAGDFFNQNEFDAWMVTAKKRPEILFYAYTKSIPFIVKRIGRIPPNFVLTASLGGKWDAIAIPYKLRCVVVVWSPEEASALGLDLDHDDSHAMKHGPSFCLLGHGIQKAGSPAAAKLADLRRRGIPYAYSRKH